MDHLDRPEDRETLLDLTKRDTSRAPPPETEHEALMRAISHLTDAVVKSSESTHKLERAIGRLIDAVEQCPMRPGLAAIG